MKFTAESKELAELINGVAGTTSSANVNLEVGKKGLLLIKSSNKGFAQHTRTDIIVDEGKEKDVATIPVAQFLGMISRRGLVTIEVTETNSLIIAAKSFRGEINLVPPTDVDDIEPSKDTLELQGETLARIKEHLPGLALVNLFIDNQPFVRIACTNNTLELMCADSVHGAYYAMAVTNQSDFSFDLPHDSLTTLIGIIEENADAVFAVEDSRVFVNSTRVSMSFPKQQVGKLIPMSGVKGIKDRCIKKPNLSTLGNIHIETLTQEISGCKHIASEKTLVSLQGTKGGYVLSYATPHGRIKSKGKCDSAWSSDDVIKISPYLFEDFLGSLSLFDTADIKVDEKTVFSHVEKDNGYEAFHICSGN